MVEQVAKRIEESVVRGKRLGAHFHKDVRSRAFSIQREVDPSQPLVPILWSRKAGPWDQGNLGKCTIMGMKGCLMSSPIKPKLSKAQVNSMRSTTKLYSLETANDEFPGQYPPDDTGSSVLDAMKLAKNMGLIDEYLWQLDYQLGLHSVCQVGSGESGVNWYDCLPDDQRILTSDLRWVPIQKLNVGDELLGFTEKGRRGRGCRSEVTALERVIKPVYEVTTDKGTVCSSAGHLFVKVDSAGQSWIRTDKVRPGFKLAYFLEPYEFDDSWEAGWLSGFFDGEGTVVGSYQVNFGQALGSTLDRAINFLEAKGFTTSIKQAKEVGTDARGIHTRKEFVNIYVSGQHHGALKFLGQIRPERLLNKCSQLWEERALYSRTSPAVTVQSVKYIGEHPVYAIGTSSETLIVEGLLAHNSFDAPDSSGIIRISPNAGVRGGHAIQRRGLDVEKRLSIYEQSWGLDWPNNPFNNKHGLFAIPWSDEERLFAEEGEYAVPIKNV